MFMDTGEIDYYCKKFEFSPIRPHPAMREAEEISGEELEAAGRAYDIMASEGRGGWEARELAAPGVAEGEYRRQCKEGRKDGV